MPDFLPASGRFLPLAVYDTGVRLTMREHRRRPELVARIAAATPPDGAIVELGAGTGSLAGGRCQPHRWRPVRRRSRPFGCGKGG